MLVKLLVFCNYVAFVSPVLKMRPMKEIVQRNKPIHRQKHLCGPSPQPWDDCEPSLCNVMSIPGSNLELQHLTTCVPLNLPSHQMLNKKLKVVPFALRAVITSSTLGPFDNGERASTPKLRCPGLASCRTLDTYKQKTTTTPTYSIDTTHEDGEKTTTTSTYSIDTTHEDGEKTTTTSTYSIDTTNEDGEKIKDVNLRFRTRRANVTRAVQRTEGTERPSVVRAQLDLERAPERDAHAQHGRRAPPLHVSGTRSLHCWRHPVLAFVVIVHFDLIV